MFRIHMKWSSVFMIVTLMVIGCASVNYVGKSFNPTTNIDIYYSKEEIKKEYTLMGHAIGSGTFTSNDKIQKKLIEEAQFKGADAILITGVGRSVRTNSAGEDQINASFLKYK